jgi:hypothetical protein
MRPILLALALVLPLAACGRPTGDFGRAAPSVLHDDLLPAVGGLIAEERRKEPVSDLNLTDDERELRDRAFAFVRAPHLGDWWLDTLVEGQRTRVLPTIDPDFDPNRYSDFLRADPYRSSEIRWAKVEADVTGDALLVPPFCAVAARVRRADDERLAVLNRRPVEDALVVEVEDRVIENAEVMAWVWRALGYRLESYRLAVDRLELETPSGRLFEVNRAILALAGTRCEGAPPYARLRISEPRRGRVIFGTDPFDGPVLQK